MDNTDRSIKELSETLELRRYEALAEKRMRNVINATFIFLCVFLFVAAACMIAMTYMKAKGG